MPKRPEQAGHDNAAFGMQDRDSEQQPLGPQVSKEPPSSREGERAWWASYTCGRWMRAGHTIESGRPTGESTVSKYQGLAQDDSDVTDGLGKNPNRKLLDYFRAIGASNQVDLQYLSDVIAEGADPKSTDKYGQTCLHEISRAWNVDVMRFFLEKGADMQQADAYGVTPLHVAAALDYKEMICFLLEMRADLGAQTCTDLQTPLHFAAKNDATVAIRLLLQHGADVGARDHKQRTPLQLAANRGRSEAARVLLELGADAGVQDSDGQLCISAMIDQMAPVARLALNQFHLTDRTTRQQFYYLHLLEPEPARKGSSCDSDGRIVNEPMPPLEFIVQKGKLDLIMHPVVLKLITVKWNLYGRTGAWILLILNFLFIVSWTTVAISVSMVRDEEHPYVFPEDWWRVLVVILALGLTVAEVSREVAELARSHRKLQRWSSWLERRVHDDLRCVHPMWPQEQHFLEKQIEFVRKMKPDYYRDLWNVFDWLVYVLLTAVFGIHVADVLIVETALREYSLRLFAVTIIFLWLRLMKHVRAFREMGPFIVMLGNIVGDVLRFLFLYVEIFIPYACAFWIIFGGMEAVPSMQTVPQLLYSLYRITLVDEYEFDAMVAMDAMMAYLLCGTFLGLSAILCVNLLIALLSDTFQRVYENAQANGVMQQAAVILQVEESMPCLRSLCDDRYVQRCCAPLGEFCDEHFVTNPERHEETRKIAVGVKETLDELLKLNRHMSPLDLEEGGDRKRRPRSALVNEGQWLSTLQELEMGQNQLSQELCALTKDVKELRVLLQNLIQSSVKNETTEDASEGSPPSPRLNKLVTSEPASDTDRVPRHQRL
ncbi:transient receptor potential cation channel subfamily A member 1 isoform X2 [Brienomyrus brachyistius]|uniref:transient receptor potential cation channel subfamily A member 1 isoform X2 n=1 Tax=Brienomyrus brachyistius TaxID=42636 RepID=UPI0020B3B2DA|nr:transient receptor potential cation channel subfamily A member 1 isoform X2 [Brienomyrus brachyistius]